MFDRDKKDEQDKTVYTVIHPDVIFDGIPYIAFIPVALSVFDFIC